MGSWDLPTVSSVERPALLHPLIMPPPVSAVAADGIEIRDVANVQTSFPGFIDAMSGLGLNIEQLP